jgi:hypothetical protein
MLRSASAACIRRRGTGHANRAPSRDASAPSRARARPARTRPRASRPRYRQSATTGGTSPIHGLSPPSPRAGGCSTWSGARALVMPRGREGDRSACLDIAPEKVDDETQEVRGLNDGVIVVCRGERALQHVRTKWRSTRRSAAAAGTTRSRWGTRSRPTCAPSPTSPAGSCSATGSAGSRSRTVRAAGRRIRSRRGRHGRPRVRR